MESMFVAEYEGKIMGNDRGYCKRRKELYDRDRGGIERDEIEKSKNRKRGSRSIKEE